MTQIPGARPVLAWLINRSFLPSPLADRVAGVLRRVETTLASAPRSGLRDLMASDSLAGRAIVTGRVGPKVTSASVLSIVDADWLIGPAARLFDRVAAAPGERSEALYQAIVLDSASFPLRQHTALLCVRRHPDEITMAHARAIVRRCLSFISQPIDPYAPVPLTMAARSACAALVAHNPGLDREILPQIRTGELALVYAAALHARRVRYREGLSAALEALRPDEERALGFARDCDRHYSALDPVAPPTSRWDRLRTFIETALVRVAVPMRFLAQLVAILAGPAIGVVVAFAVNHWFLRLPQHVEFGSGDAIGALGALVAVHVLASELAADRLTGPIARASSFPVALQSGYLTGLLILARSVLHPSRHTLTTYSIVSLGLMAALIGLVVIALLTLLRRTDPVRAVEALEVRRRAETLAAGRALGRMHAAALRQREMLSGFAWASSELTAPLGERREQITARRAGYLLLHERRLRRLARRDEYRQERLSLAMVSVIGVPVERNDELFSLIPAYGSTLTRGDIGRSTRLQRVRRYRDIDQVGEYVGALLSLADAQTRAGNVAGAERVRESLLELLRLHLRGVRSSRVLRDSEEQVGLIPALRTIAVQGVRALAEADDANTRELHLGLLQRTLTLTDTADVFAATLSAQLGLLDLPLRKAALHQLLWDCGSRAIEVGDRVSLRKVREDITRMFRSDRRGVELVGQLVQLAAITRASQAESFWVWHKEHHGSHEYFPLTAMRIGASALRVGYASLALTVALSLSNHDAAKWIAYFERDTVADEEKTHDQLYGQLLGPDPQLALQDFARFLGDANKAVTKPAQTS